MLNIREAALVSGIREATIKSHIKRKWLATVAGFIDEQELCEYCARQWKRGSVYMYPPDRLIGRISEIDDWGFELLYKEQKKPPRKSKAYLDELQSIMMQ